MEKRPFLLPIPFTFSRFILIPSGDAPLLGVGTPLLRRRHAVWTAGPMAAEALRRHIQKASAHVVNLVGLSLDPRPRPYRTV